MGRESTRRRGKRRERASDETRGDVGDEERFRGCHTEHLPLLRRARERDHLRNLLTFLTLLPIPSPSA